MQYNYWHPSALFFSFMMANIISSDWLVCHSFQRPQSYSRYQVIIILTTSIMFHVWHNYTALALYYKQQSNTHVHIQSYPHTPYGCLTNYTSTNSKIYTVYLCRNINKWPITASVCESYIKQMLQLVCFPLRKRSIILYFVMACGSHAHSTGNLVIRQWGTFKKSHEPQNTGEYDTASFTYFNH